MYTNVNLAAPVGVLLFLGTGFLLLTVGLALIYSPMRLSTFAAKVIAEYLDGGDADVLKTYCGELFRARFASRLWMRRLISSVRQPVLVELACAGMRLPVVNWFAWHVFFGRGSFPDVDPHWTAQTAS